MVVAGSHSPQVEELVVLRCCQFLYGPVSKLSFLRIDDAFRNTAMSVQFVLKKFNAAERLT